jgi:transglutaminase-like putative cysteine protease
MIASLSPMLAHALLSTVVSSTPLTVVADETSSAPKVAESRTYRIRQTVTLADVPATAKEVRLWVPIPADGAWQHVLDRRVVEAPEGWSLVHQPECDADMVVVTTKGGGSPKVVVETTVVRESPKYDLAAYAGQELQPRLFSAEMRPDAPLMSAADMRVSELATKACAGETNLGRKVVKLLDAVADVADHYSKDATKPNCGRGAAEDCLDNGGGCCTDLHSLFIAAARQQGIPARIQFGYRLKADKMDTEYDPSYRCSDRHRGRRRGRACGARGQLRHRRRASGLAVAGPRARAHAQAEQRADPDDVVRLGRDRRPGGRRASLEGREAVEAVSDDQVPGADSEGRGEVVRRRDAVLGSRSSGRDPSFLRGRFHRRPRPPAPNRLNRH